MTVFMEKLKKWCETGTVKYDDSHLAIADDQDIEALGEDLVEIIAGVFELAALHREPERHVRRFGRRPEMGEKGGEVRVIHFIVDDEPGVNGNFMPIDV